MSAGLTLRIMHRRIHLIALSAVGLLVSLLVAPATASAAGTSIVPTHLAYPSTGTTAIGTGIDGTNQNAQLAETLPAAVARSWRNAPPICPQSNGMTASTISVTRTFTIVDETGYQCSYVSAYLTATGALQWRKSYHLAFSATVTDGKAYVLHDLPDTGESRVDALSARTGGVLWSAQQGVSADQRESVGSGLVARSSSVLSAATGKPAFDLGMRFGEHGQTLISGGRLYLAGDGGVQAFDTAGKQLWATRYPAGGHGYSANVNGSMPSLHGGLLYTPGTVTTVFGAKTGRIVRTLPSSATSWAFDGKVGFATTTGTTAVPATGGASGTPAVPATLRAFDLTSGKVLWTRALPLVGGSGQVPSEASAAPVVANGIVWLAHTADSGSPTGILAVDERTGAVRNSIVDACSAGGGTGNLVVAQHRLFVSTGCGVQSYAPSR